MVATPTSTFGLPEILFGLLPANVLPYLVRKIGPAKASRATILHETISASKALELGLVDDVNENLNESLRKLSLKLLRVDPNTFMALKTLMNQIAPVSAEAIKAAQVCFTSLISEPKNVEKIKLFLSTQES